MDDEKEQIEICEGCGSRIDEDGCNCDDSEDYL